MTDEPAFDLRALAVPAYAPSLLFGIGDGAILPVIALTARDLGASVAVAALVVMLIDLGSLVFNVPASVLTARYGERRVITGAAATGVLASVICFVGGSLPVFCVGVLLLGFSASVFMLARQSYLTEAVPVRYRARALSTLGGVMRVGVFVGPFIGAAAIHTGGLPAAYLVCGSALLLAGVLSSRMPDLPPHPHLATARAQVTVRGVLRDHRRVFLTVGVGILLVAAVRASRQTVIPLWADHLGLSPQTASVVYGIAGGVDMLVFYPAGKVMDVKGRRWVTVPSMVVMGLALLAIPLTSGVVPLTLVSCVLGFGNGIGSGMVMTLGADFSPDVGRAQFLGIWRELSDIGGTAGPVLLSALTATVSLGAGVAAAGAVGLVAAVVLYRAVPTGRYSKIS
ncbi:MFS transporter [Luteipulveratus sp. YIM 133132]|uniref:MFS transporter n=1 Tax=Luteipulveratus flavus TaxID=3031728 RepID=A0ABT6C3W0_9MICO|nr:MULTISPECIES: MFS transporter [unclassified Luteipulveratus]MDE9367489.1 MFS transporter [Luteipulveratus sp. YIM 133132]MDF8263445.1 MFS transporter [Luteipulveratus sp. YIM 133296]